ncbi:MAG: fused MFS/spermidine synthase [Myxococcota bacterium]|nr:fused MFS/spermidine synthase [Myxococcota bacterium]
MRSWRGALLAVALGSGAAALVYQTVWVRWFQLLFGSTAYAASATLCAFFAGLAIGAEGFGRVAVRARRPLRAYAALEVAAAGLALVVPLVFAAYDSLYAGLYAELAARPAAFVALKFGLALLVMLPPAVLLGGTTPLLAAAYVDDPRRLGADGGRLYAVNTLGAAGGSAAGALWLPDWIGVHATYGVAIGLSLLVALAAWRLSRPAPVAPAPRAAFAPSDEPARAPLSLRLVAFASGFGTLALEVLLIRALALVFDHSVYSYGAVLVVVLLALAAGAALVSASEGRVPARLLLGAALAATAALLFAVPWAASQVAAAGASGPGRLLGGLGWTALLGGPPLLVGALVLPLTFRLAAGGSVGRRIGGLLAANTVGGILGSLCASFVLLDGLGLWTSIALLGVAYALAAGAVEGAPRERVLRLVPVAAVAGAVLALGLGPRDLPVVRLGSGEALVASEEGAYGVVSVIDGPFGRRMKIDNHYTLAGAGRLLPLKERAGHIPLLLHPRPRRVLFVGSATGHTAGAAVQHEVEEIVLVEIVPEVQALASAHFAATNHDVYRDPRTRLVVEDGRNHVRATRERYDVIVADLFTPWRPGVGSLYTEEHFRAVRERLAPGGLFCQWLPIYQHTRQTFATVAAGFLDVFPDAVLWRGEFFTHTVPRAALIGFADGPAPVEAVEERVRALAASGVADRWITDPRGFWMLYAGPLAAAAPGLAAVPRHSDARPRFEYLAGSVSELERRAFLRTHWPAFARSLLDVPGERPPFEPVLARARDGADFARANALHLDDRKQEFRELWGRIRMRVPGELLRPPDPSVAEMWMAR